MSRALSLAMALWLLAGCDTVAIDKPIGEPISSKEKASLVGTWVETEGGVTDIRRSKKGDLYIGSLSWNEKESQFKAETLAVTLTTIGQSQYVFMKSEEELVFCRFQRKDDSSFELTLPDPKAFRKVVEESIAASKGDKSKAFGVVKEEGSNLLVRLSSESKELLEFFQSPKIDACFESKSILKYKRVHR